MAKQEKPTEEKNLQANRKSLQAKLTQPIVNFLVRLHVTPNQITWFGLIISLVACGLVISGQCLWAGIMLILGSALDMLDGGVARATGKVSRRGAFLDSTFDRVSEGALFISLIISYNIQGEIWLSSIAAGALLCSFMVSYLRARAEALSLTKTVGFFTRPERIIALTIGLLLGHWWPIILVISLGIIFICSLATAIQRAVHIWKNI